MTGFTHILAPGDSVTVEIDGMHVALTHNVDADGDHFVELGGRDCDLTGEMPGVYYPVPMAPRCECGSTGRTYITAFVGALQCCDNSQCAHFGEPFAAVKS